MRRGLPMMVWAVVWTVVVAVATVSVWSAISGAGAHVTNQAAPKLPSIDSLTPTPRPTPQPTPREPSQLTPQPSPRTSSRPTHRPTPRPSPSDTTPDNPAPVAVQRSWSGQAGRVTATCRGQAIRLDAAVPADGFSVEIGSRGPDTLEVQFHQTRSESESKVVGVCRSEGPRFAVSQE